MEIEHIYLEVFIFFFFFFFSFFFFFFFISFIWGHDTVLF